MAPLLSAILSLEIDCISARVRYFDSLRQRTRVFEKEVDSM